MAQVVKVEIPIEATDKTASGVNSAEKRLSGLGKTIQKMQRQLDRLNSASYKIDIDANDDATAKLADVEGAAEKADGEDVMIDVDVDDQASNILSGVNDAASAVDAADPTVDVDADDAASPVLHQVEDEAAALHGMEPTVEINADDAASPVIDDVDAKAESLNGKVVDIMIKATNMATAPLSAAADALTSPVAQTAGVMGASFGVYDSVSTFADFEQGMAQVGAISGATAGELDRLTEKAQYMGATTKFTATQSAEAFNYMAMAGWKTEDMISGIEGIMNLAAASGEDLGTTSDIVTDALTAFGLQAADSGHFADVLAKASANSNTNVSMLGESFKYVAPLAGAMHYSIEDVGVALGLMANAGVKSSMAGTALRRAITNLSAPTDKVQAAMDKYGISMTNAEGKQRSLGELMGHLRTQLGGLEDQEKSAAVSTLFGAEALSGMLAVINASDDDYSKLTESINNADGAAQDMAATMLDTMQGSFTLMQSAIEGVENDLGGRLAPYFRSLADGITDAMPGATRIIDSFMDKVDQFAKRERLVFDQMVKSDEWKDGSFIDKIDIAWNTLIGEPFLEWAGGEGLHLISGGIGTLFSEAFKILPGGEEAGIGSWLSAGVLAKGAVTTATGIISLTEKLSALSPALGAIAPVAAGAAAAIGLIAVAVDNYNQKQINTSLAEHFGDIELSAEQAEAVASKVLDATWTVNVDLALGELKGADEARKKAEDALKSNEALTYKSGVGIELSADEQSAYQENISTFVESKIDELESRTFSAHIMVGTFLQSEEGQTLSNAIDQWALEDTMNLEGLSSQLTEAVDQALSDGIIEVDEQSHIAELQGKINSILSNWKQAESEAQMDLISQKYGNLTGEQLSAGSFEAVMESLRTQRETNEQALDQTSTAFYEMINAMNDSGRLSEIGLNKKDLTDQWGTAMRGEVAKGLANSVNFEAGTLNKAYSEEMTGFREESSANAAERIGNMEDYYLSGARDANGNVDYGKVDAIGLSASLYDSASAMVNGKADKGLQEMYKAMTPDVSAMTDYINNAFDAEGNQLYKIPQTVMDAYNSAMEVGAAAGDFDAGMQLMANQIAKSGNEGLINAITEYGLGGPEMQEAMRRSLAEVGDDVTLEGIKAKVEQPELELDKDTWLSSLQESLGDLADVETETEADVTVKVKKGDTLSEIGEAVGADWHEIAEYNGLEDPYTIYPDMEIKIPKESINMDASEVGASMDEAVSELSAAGTGLEITTEGLKVTLGDVQVDPADTLARIAEAVGTTVEALQGAGITETTIETGATVTIPPELINVETDGLNAAIEQAMSGNTAEGGETDAKTDVNVTAGTVKADEAYTEAQSETQKTFAEPMPTDGEADVTLTQTNNAAEIYEETGSQVRSTYAAGFSASAPVNVTLDWNILNPTASISVSGAGTGTGSLHAAFSAEGRYVDGPLLSVVGEDGPEYIVPVGAKHRERGLELWAQAGKALGVMGNGDGIPAFADGGLIGADENEIATPFEKARKAPDTSNNGGEGSYPNNSTPVTIEAANSAIQSPQTQSGAQSIPVSVNVTMNPTVTIDGNGMDEDGIFEVLKNRIREMADDLADEVGERLSEIFSNMPLRGEV